MKKINSKGMMQGAIALSIAAFIRVQCSRGILGVDTFKEIIEAAIRDC